MMNGWRMRAAATAALVLAPWIGAGVLAAGWDDYEPSTFAAAIDGQKSIFGGELDEADWNILAARLVYQVDAIYTGERRPIGPAHKRILEGWLVSFPSRPDLIARFGTEVRFIEEGKAYWLPVQEVLIAGLTEDAEIGEKVRLFVGLIGSANDDWVFIVNRFDGLERPGD